MAIEERRQCRCSHMETSVSDSYRRQRQTFMPDRQVSSRVLNHGLIPTETFPCNSRRKMPGNASFSTRGCPPGIWWSH